MRGAEFLDRRRRDMTRTFTRYDRLRADLAVLQGAALVRTHDVQATAELLRVLAAIDAVADRPTGEGAA